MEVAAAKEQSLILKGKRTKRQRPQSPIPFSISPPLLSFESPNMEEEFTVLASKDKISTLGFDVQKESVNVMITSSYSSVSSSSNTIFKAAPAEGEEYDEDQDMANCLILLAQGHSLPHTNRQEGILRCYNDNNNNNNNKNGDMYRFSSRKFLETCSNGGKSGYYVYQCKTCDRTFPSFQALGGHRASHKKPKPTSFYSNLDHKKTIYNDAVSLLTTNTTTYNNKNNNNRSSLMLYGKANNKVHQCGVCGAEFTSGQALGGHMRRHRGAVAVSAAATVPVVATNTELSLSSMSFDQISDGQDHKVPAIKRAKNTVASLDLNLNLPAPEDENRVNGFSFTSKQNQEQEHEEIKKQREEQKSLILSSPTLVDCHY